MRKILLLIMLFFYLADVSRASEEKGLKILRKECGEYLKMGRLIFEEAKETALSEIKREWEKLQKMKYFADNVDKIYESEEWEKGVSLRIFVSSSMGENLLKNYVNEAKKYNGILVFRGVPSGSWKELSNLVNNITNGKESSLQIDDEAFRKFGVSKVPTIILSKQDEIFSDEPEIIFDKIEGSISINHALKIFSEEGELSDIAINISKKGS